MKILEKEFRSGMAGFSGNDALDYKQIARTGNLAVYERSRNGIVKDFEVFFVTVKPKGFQIMNGKPLEDDTEYYASSGTFGKTAYSFHGKFAKDAALKKFVELNSNKKLDKTNETTVAVSHLIPDSEFSTQDFAAYNNISYPMAVLSMKEMLANNLIKFVRTERRASRGKKTNLFSKS